MEEITNQQRLQDDLDYFDINDYLLNCKAEIDHRINQHRIKIAALKLTRGKK